MTSILDRPVLQGYTITSERTEDNPSWGAPHRAYKVTVTNPRGRRYTTPFCMGVLVEGEPTVEDVLADLLTNAASYTATQNFEEWAREQGYTWETRAERRRALDIYRHCKRQAAKVETFFSAKELVAAIEAIDY